MPTSPRSLTWSLFRRRYTFFDLIRKDRRFLVFITACFFVAGLAYPHPQLAMWVGFLLAGYSAIANDSIQTVGTFLASNRHRPWWLLWLFVGGLLALTVAYSWAVYDGDVSYQRLSAKGFGAPPETFTFLQVAAPVFLLVLTRLRMPVSTTFLLLSCFATSPAGLEAMLIKSVSGYGVAFVGAALLWAALAPVMRRRFQGPAAPYWPVLQWVSTGFLWSSWVMQDAANVAVYLPRSLSVGAFVAFAGFLVAGLGVLFYLRGDRIQGVVTEKSEVEDVRHATVIDFAYGLLLFGFKEVSVVPMSTTWVFLGLLAGRELALHLHRIGPTDRTLQTRLRLIGKDLGYAGIGLAVSLALAVASNPHLFFG